MSSNVLNLFTAAEGKGLQLFEYGYYEALESGLLLFDMAELNSKNVDFRNVKPKKIAYKQSVTENGDSLEWYDSDIKETPLVVDSVDTQDSTTLILTIKDYSGSTPQVGETLFNRETEVYYIVTAVSNKTLTMSTPDTSASANDNLIRVGFAKKVKDNDGYNYTRPDAVKMYNYFEFTEQKITSDMITNNRNGLFYQDANERLKEEFADASRKIVSQMIRSLYIGEKNKYTDGSYDRITTGGINSFLPSDYKVDIGGTNAAGVADVKKNFRNEVTAASQAGLETTSRGRLILCTTAFKQKISDLYDDNIRYVDELEKINIGIDEVDLVGYRARLVESNVLNNIYGTKAVAFLIPVDYMYLHVLPKLVADETGKKVENFGKGYVYKKPQTTAEISELGLFTNYSFMFGGINSGGYRKMEYTEPSL